MQHDGKISLNAHRLINTYEILFRTLAILEYKIHGVESAQNVYLNREGVMEMMKESERPYISFCEGLAFYYESNGQNKGVL